MSESDERRATRPAAARRAAAEMDQEATAIKVCTKALGTLDEDARRRVMGYLRDRFVAQPTMVAAMAELDRNLDESEATAARLKAELAARQKER